MLTPSWWLICLAKPRLCPFLLHGIVGLFPVYICFLHCFTSCRICLKKKISSCSLIQNLTISFYPHQTEVMFKIQLYPTDYMKHIAVNSYVFKRFWVEMSEPAGTPHRHKPKQHATIETFQLLTEQRWDSPSWHGPPLFWRRLSTQISERSSASA